nr:fumarylacetoacetate hydrolase family protein [Pontibacillus sp. ALD_SL1]
MSEILLKEGFLMKFVTFELNGSDTWGVEVDQRVHFSSEWTERYPNLLEFIRSGARIDREEVLGWESVGYEDVQVKAPFLPPKNIICVGKNYKEHALEMTQQDPGSIPEDPILFTKPATSVVGSGEVVEVHEKLTSQLDYEGELAVIIGKEGRDLTQEEAKDYIFGYSIVNDVTARDLQKKHKQFFKGKSLDTSAPFGPAIVPAEDIDDPQYLSIKTYINEEIRQDGNTTDMIFSIAELIEIISAGMTLEPGDVIATGTPSGVGKGMNPPQYLKSGDTMTISIEGIGTLENQVK